MPQSQKINVALARQVPRREKKPSIYKDPVHARRVFACDVAL
jgi:hypothetical protein